jgi:hypothetical protein
MRLDISVIGKNKQELLSKIKSLANSLNREGTDTNCSGEDFDYTFSDTNDLWEENPQVVKNLEG